MNPACCYRRARSCRNAFFSPHVLGVLYFVSSALLCAHAEGGRQGNQQIECITPDGRVTAISTLDVSATDGAAAIPARNTISCNLREGRTVFIIPFPKGALFDRFTLINENAAACGELEIAVSDAHLLADSPDWVEVEGIVPFAHKRLFKLSMLGIKAKYVKLSFHVENTAPITRSDRQFKLRLVAAANLSAAGAALGPPAPRANVIAAPGRF
jgi:hypothetical protein